MVTNDSVVGLIDAVRSTLLVSPATRGFRVRSSRSKLTTPIESRDGSQARTG